MRDFAALKAPLREEALDAALARAECEGLSHLAFLQLLIGELAAARRDQSIAYRVREAKFAELKTLATFDWQFNAAAIPRIQIEELATAEFIRRGQNLVLVGQSGVGKSFLAQAIGHAACVQGWRVRYTTSANLLADLRTRLADRTLPARVRYYANYDLLIIDEFGFDRLERQESQESANLLYKVIDARKERKSTALVSNIDFQEWGAYLGDPPLAMAMIDRVVDRAVVLKIAGKSYRMHRAQTVRSTPGSSAAPRK